MRRARWAGCFFALSTAVACGQMPPASQPAAPASAAGTTASVDSVQAQNDQLERDLKRARDDLAQARQSPQTEQGKISAVMEKYGITPVVVSLFALAIGLLALAWAVVLGVSAARMRKAASQTQRTAEKELKQLKDQVQDYQLRSQNAVKTKLPSRKGPTRAAAAPEKSVPERSQARPLPVEEAVQKPKQEMPPLANERVLTVSPDELPAEPFPASLAAPSAGAALLTGNLLRDYAMARTLEHEGPELFQQLYRPVGLSCLNLNDVRPGENLTLRFEEAPRGMFLAVRHEGETLVVPALDKDFVGVRPSLEGVFAFPAVSEAGMRLVRPATVRKAGDEWTLQTGGEIARG